MSPVFNAYCVVPGFIPDRLSVCLHVTVIDCAVTVAVGAVFVGAVLSIFTIVVASADTFPTLSTALNLTVSFLFTVYEIVNVQFVVVNALVVHALFSYHSILSIPE